MLEDVAEAARSGAVVVEGQRDAAALRALGVGGEVVVLNRGTSILALCEDLACDHQRIVVLVDWDSKGDELAGRLSAGLSRGGVEVDLAMRQELRRLTRGSVKCVEELASFHRRVAAAASKPPAIRAAVETASWRQRRRRRLEASARKSAGRRGPSP